MAVPRRTTALAVCAAAGLGAEMLSPDRGDVSLWLPDLAVGLVLAGAALLGRRGQRVLLGLGAVAWFLGTVTPAASFLHVGVLVHALVTYPGWRPAGRAPGTTVAIGYVVAAGVAVRPGEAAVLGLATGLVAVLAGRHVRAHGPLRRHTGRALAAGGVLATALVAGVALRAGVPVAADALTVLRLYEAGVVLVAVVLVTGPAGPPVGRVTDLVVDLGGTRAGTVRTALAGALGDPSLRLGYAAADGTWRDAEGAPVALPDAGSGRSATVVERDGRPIAVLVHVDGLLADPALGAAVSSATRLAGSHAALRTEVDRRLAELADSQRRLVQAADEERDRLESRLREGAEARLAALGEILDRAGSVSPAAAARVAAARGELVHASGDLRDLARGLRPRELDAGLPSALTELARRTPLPVDVVAPAGRYPATVESTVWFVCSEALANSVRHAGATAARIEVTDRDGVLRLVVVDDGRGGAEPARGSGLRGLADRVGALGGRMTVRSVAGAGTRVAVELPLDRHPP